LTEPTAAVCADRCSASGIPGTVADEIRSATRTMEPSAVADDLNEISVLVNVAHRLLLTVREDIDASPTLQHIVDDLNIAHDQLDLLLDRIGQAIDLADAAADHGPREQRPAIH
jgi:hypothetical protein